MGVGTSKLHMVQGSIVHPKEVKSVSPRDIFTPVFIAPLFTMTRIWKQPKCPPIDESLKTMWHIYIYIHVVEYYSAIKKNGILPFVTTWMDLEGIMLNEISQKKTNTV